MSHICGSESGHHWFRSWFVAYSAPNHYLNQCWDIVNWIFTNKLQIDMLNMCNNGTMLFLCSNLWNVLILKFLFICIFDVGMPLFTFICHCCNITHAWQHSLSKTMLIWSCVTQPRWIKAFIYDLFLQYMEYEYYPTWAPWLALSIHYEQTSSESGHST